MAQLSKISVSIHSVSGEENHESMKDIAKAKLFAQTSNMLAHFTDVRNDEISIEEEEHEQTPQ